MVSKVQPILIFCQLWWIEFLTICLLLRLVCLHWHVYQLIILIKDGLLFRLWNSTFNAQGLKIIIVVVHVGIVKIYVRALEALRKKERWDEIQLCWLSYWINDNIKVDGKIPQVKKCFFCSKNSIDPSNPKMQLCKDIIDY